MIRKSYIALIAFLILLSLNLHAQESTRQWTHFRGNELKSIAEEGTYPIQWTDSTNIEWKTEIRGRAWSSPVVYGDQIWCTSATKDGNEMFVVCIDYNTGKIIKEIALFQPDSLYRIHPVNSFATPTPAIEEGFVYVHFGRYGSACINTETGEKVWERRDLICEHVQGPGSSVFLYKDMIVLHMEGIDRMRIYALDKHTGETIWVIERNEKWYEGIDEIGRKAYITPIVIVVDGRELLISNGSCVCDAMDVNTGELVWYIPQGVDSTISMPVESDGILYFYTGFVTKENGENECDLLAVDPSGTGDITGNILWRVSSPMLQLQTPVIYDGLLYTVDSKSMLFCLDAFTGETIWQEKLKGKYHSSPVWADGKVYINSTRGKTYVFKAGREKELLTENSLEGEIWSTPAFLQGEILMRTSKFLYKIK
jgi:outer membrane protein assembly factor BamB